MKDKLLNILILMPFIWTFSGLLLLQNGDKLMIVAIVISILATLLRSGINSIKKNIKERRFWLVLMMTIYMIFSYYYHGASSREMRALLGGALFLLTFPRELINNRILKWLTVLGSIVILSSTYYFSAYLNLSRGTWPINAIPLATMGAVITVLALISLLNANHYRDRIILIFAILMSSSAVIMGQTRGIWLSLIITVFIILLPKLRIKQINWKYASIAVVILLLSAYAAKPKIEQRIDQTQVEITKIQQGDLHSSIGLRLQMWVLAPRLIEDNLLLGSGNGHKEIFRSLYKDGYIKDSLVEFAPAHYHNQYLDRLIRSGFIGLTLLIIMLAYPVILVSEGYSRQIAIGIVAVYSISGLTDVPLNHGATIFMYLLLIFTLQTKHDKASG